MVYQFVFILKIDKTCENIDKLMKNKIFFKDIGNNFLIS